MEQNSVLLVTLDKSSAQADFLLSTRDIHFLLFLPCPRTQIGYSEGLIPGPLWRASWPLETSVDVSMQGE